jgi:hypothetical protein
VKRVLSLIALMSLCLGLTVGCGKKDPTTDAAPVTNSGTPEPTVTKTGAPTNDTGQMGKPAVNPGGG